MANGFKSGGRQKGSSNKLTGTVKEMISYVVTNELHHLPRLLKHTDPKEKADYILKLLPYVVPRVLPVEETVQSPETKLYKLFEREMEKNGRKETVNNLSANI